MRLGQRATTIIDEGEFARVEATVDQIIGWPVYRIAVERMAAFLAAEGDAEMGALTALYEFYEREARPVWNVEDGRGPVPPTQAGMLRLPVPLVLTLYDLWTETFPRDESGVTADPDGDPPSAVDALVPPGPVRDKLNKGLRAARTR